MGEWADIYIDICQDIYASVSFWPDFGTSCLAALDFIFLPLAGIKFFLSKNVTGCRFQLYSCCFSSDFPWLLPTFPIWPYLFFIALFYLVLCVLGLILTAVDMHIMGIVWDFSSFSALFWCSSVASSFVILRLLSLSMVPDPPIQYPCPPTMLYCIPNGFDFPSFVTFNASLILSDI